MSRPLFENLESRLVFSAVFASAALSMLHAATVHAQPATRRAPATQPIDLSGVKSFVYQLQNIDTAALSKTKFDLAVIDYSADGTDEKRFSAKQIRHLRDGEGGHKTVLSYMSIGEAEDYRWYWKKEWVGADGKPSREGPKWLGPVDPDWPGNFKVKYWESAWQAVVMQYVDRVIEAGFDGVYLDIIDAYEFWGPGGASGANRKTAEAEMVEFVKSIATYARDTKGIKQFIVFVQNSEELARHKDYLAAVNGIGREDTWYNGNKPNKTATVAEVTGNLDLFKKAGKSVLCIDYVTREKTINDFYAKASAKGYIPYASVRDLDKLTINKGHEP